jgi:hypothetical protein
VVEMVLTSRRPAERRATPVAAPRESRSHSNSYHPAAPLRSRTRERGGPRAAPGRGGYCRDEHPREHRSGGLRGPRAPPVPADPGHRSLLLGDHRGHGGRAGRARLSGAAAGGA